MVTESGVKRSETLNAGCIRFAFFSGNGTIDR